MCNIKKEWKIVDIVSWGATYFINNGFSNGKKEIEWFLCYIFNCKHMDLFLKFEYKLTSEQLKLLKKMLKRRLLGEPFQHIIGQGTFYGRDFIVNSNVLVPRPETEIIIDILKKKKKVCSILDVGTGSGCIAITCLLENLCQNIYATDICSNALKIAKENAKVYNIESIEFKYHNFLKEDFNMKFDIVVSNPPYIEFENINNLSMEVRKYDPMIALTDFKNGLLFYHRFANVFHDLVNDNGSLILEISGTKNMQSLINIFNQHNLQTKFFKDLQHDYRVVEVFK